MRLHHLFDDPSTRRVVANAENDAIERMARLTPRQRQILDLIVDGRLNKVAAQELGISTRTLENHRSELIARTGVKNFAELVRLAILAGQ